MPIPGSGTTTTTTSSDWHSSLPTIPTEASEHVREGGSAGRGSLVRPISENLDPGCDESLEMRFNSCCHLHQGREDRPSLRDVAKPSLPQSGDFCGPNLMVSALSENSQNGRSRSEPRSGHRLSVALGFGPARRLSTTFSAELRLSPESPPPLRHASQGCWL